MKQDYKEVAERMVEDAFHRECCLSVLVEDIYDERFWEIIIENVKPDLKDKIDFPNPTPKGTRGKDILKKFKSFVKKNFIICIDSDCEYLYDDKIWYIADYIYHTIVYSKENFQCNHLSLNEICKDLTAKSYDFEGLFENISRKVSPLFYIWLLFKTNNLHQFNDLINNETFEEILSFEGIQFDNIGDENILCQSIEDRVNNTLQILKNAMDESWYDSTFEYDIPEIKKRLTEQYLIREEEILSFCYGHGVLEQFVKPFMVKLIEKLKTLKTEEIRQTLSEASNEDINNTIRRIENIAQQDIKTKLNDSFKYLVYGAVDTGSRQPSEKMDIRVYFQLYQNPDCYIIINIILPFCRNAVCRYPRSQKL
ncbi:DUF4435 domain-containing protein [Desulfobacterales bacterium HSG2]|nr:DUF4435 domain-containing protein [Desulfobacterales bacterium HSG2]